MCGGIHHDLRLHQSDAHRGCGMACRPLRASRNSTSPPPYGPGYCLAALRACERPTLRRSTTGPRLEGPEGLIGNSPVRQGRVGTVIRGRSGGPVGKSRVRQGPGGSSHPRWRSEGPAGCGLHRSIAGTWHHVRWPIHWGQSLSALRASCGSQIIAFPVLTDRAIAWRPYGPVRGTVIRGRSGGPAGAPAASVDARGKEHAPQETERKREGNRVRIAIRPEEDVGIRTGW